MLLQTRKSLAYFVKSLSNAQVNHIPKGFSNNVIWNFGHCIVTQQLMINGASGLPLLVDADMIALYKKGTKPTRVITEAEVTALLELSKKTLMQLNTDKEEGNFKNFQGFEVRLFGATIHTIEEALLFNFAHENMHLGYAMALKNAVLQESNQI